MVKQPTPEVPASPIESPANSPPPKAHLPQLNYEEALRELMSCVQTASSTPERIYMLREIIIKTNLTLQFDISLTDDPSKTTFAKNAAKKKKRDKKAADKAQKQIRHVPKYTQKSMKDSLYTKWTEDEKKRYIEAVELYGRDN